MCVDAKHLVIDFWCYWIEWNERNFSSTSNFSSFSLHLFPINTILHFDSQIPEMPAYRGLIDPDTPQEALTRTGFDGKEYELVFSDEFNEEGRQFYPGMDPYWEAVDLHYW